MLATMCGRASDKPARQAAVEVPVVTIDKSQEKQAARLKMIDKLIDAGVFASVEMHGAVPYITARRVFYQGDFEDKQKLVSVVYGYYLNGNSGEFVRIVDARTGKSVGTYSPAGGLEMKEP